MNLLVDIGNSRVKWALHGGDRWVSGKPRPIEQSWQSTFDGLWGEQAHPESVVVACVAGGDAESALNTWVAARWRLEPRYVRAQRDGLGLHNTYYRPEQLGDDRWVAAIGARHLASGTVGIVDCGTAITIDVLAADNRFLGGVIVPGFELAARALLSSTAGVDERAQAVRGLLGRSTGEGVTNGVHHLTIGGVRYLMAAIESEIDDSITWFVTGGAALEVFDARDSRIRYEPELVLRGLGAALEDNN